MIKSADLNGDNYPDFYMTGYNSNKKIKILWNNGDGTFSYLNPVGIKDSQPEESSFFEVNPNPFLSATNIKFNCNEVSDVSVQIFSMQGREIKSLLNDQKIKGTFQLTWDGTDNSGRKCPTGVYFIILEVNGNLYSKKIIHY
jgi:flagellar hook assembly protein FlgD